MAKVIDIINIQNIPHEFSFVNNSLLKLLEKIEFDIYNNQPSIDGKSVSKVLHLITDDVIGIDIPWTGIWFLVNCEN